VRQNQRQGEQILAKYRSQAADFPPTASRRGVANEKEKLAKDLARDMNASLNKAAGEGNGAALPCAKTKGNRGQTLPEHLH